MWMDRESMTHIEEEKTSMRYYSLIDIYEPSSLLLSVDLLLQPFTFIYTFPLLPF